MELIIDENALFGKSYPTENRAAKYCSAEFL